MIRTCVICGRESKGVTCRSVECIKERKKQTKREWQRGDHARAYARAYKEANCPPKWIPEQRLCVRCCRTYMAKHSTQKQCNLPGCILVMIASCANCGKEYRRYPDRRGSACCCEDCRKAYLCAQKHRRNSLYCRRPEVKEAHRRRVANNPLRNARHKTEEYREKMRQRNVTPERRAWQRAYRAIHFADLSRRWRESKERQKSRRAASLFLSMSYAVETLCPKPSANS